MFVLHTSMLIACIVSRMSKLYKIDPVFNYRIWGGNRLKEKYGYQSDLPNIGECYHVIAMPGHLDCWVPEANMPLSQFYVEHRDLFDCHKDEMPVRVASANPIAPMSIQLHPNDEYAMKHEGKKGKPDGVFFIEGEGDMVLGHNASTKEEFIEMVNNEQWDELVRKIRVKQGDFVDVPFGTLHAFGAGFLLIEFTQNADLTYRLYDYDRIDPTTNSKRVLHHQQVLDNVKIPDGDTKVVELNKEIGDGYTYTLFHDEANVYTAGRYEVWHQADIERKEFYFLTCIDGTGFIEGHPFYGGDTWFVPVKFGPINISGHLDVVFVTMIKG
jgi:mannose-6-phosphate isomerase